MSRPSTHEEPQTTHTRVRVRVEQADVDPFESAFTSAFRIGRGMECELHIDSGLVSRLHAEAVYEAGSWWVYDRGSTNGIYVEGEKVDRVRLDGPLVVHLGRKAPALHFSLEDAAGQIEMPRSRSPLRSPEEKPATAPGAVPLHAAPTRHQEAPPSHDQNVAAPGDFVDKLPSAARSASSYDASPVDPSVSQVIRRYFVDDPSRPAGEHTMMIRRAYQKVQEKQKQKETGIKRVYLALIAGVVGLLLLAVGLLIYQEIRIQGFQEQAATIFKQVKEIELSTAELRYRLIEDEAFAQRMAEQEQQRRKQRRAYAGYVEELGLYRKLDDEEKLIYQTARIFNESEFEMPAGFVREVREVMHNYWLAGARTKFERVIQQAEERGYTRHIVETMQKYGLPPEFFYLALQESWVDTSAVGPATRWGIAKGMWQFIPTTAREYGLRTGPREGVRTVDPLDDRHDFRKATEAAAKYLLYIHSTPAQASGLLVMASYNWGEHRVIKKLQDLPTSRDVFRVAFEDIPQDIDSRNYWRFLVEYEERMPKETKDYVLKIFAAAVIGQDPRRYDFDFDNPLNRYLEDGLPQDG